MSLLRRGVQAIGADYHQWRVLTAVMLKVDMRSTSPLQIGDKRPRDGIGWGFISVHGITGVIAAVVLAIFPNLFGGALVSMSIIMMLLATALLNDYQTVVASPADFDVLGYQPISSRTYFLSRLTNLVIYAGTIGVLTGGPSLVAVLVWHGLLAMTGWLAALAAAVLWVVLIITTGYATLLRLVRPDRLKRWLSYLQLLSSMILYGSFLLLPLFIGQRFAASIVLEPNPWLLLYPPAWFACFPLVASGTLDVVAALSLIVAIGSTAAMAVVLRGRLSLSYAARLGALFSAGGSTAKRRQTGPASRRRALPWLTLAPAELRVMASLIRAQFRHDMRFRMVVLSAFPLALCVLAVPFLHKWGGADAALDSIMTLGLLHLSTIMLPMTLLDSLRYSESFRASWIFFSTPSDPAKLTVQAVNCTGLFFLLPYLAMVGAALCWLFEDVTRGMAHAFLLGLSTLATLQLTLLATPLIPFSEPPPKGRQSGRHVVVAIVASVVGYAVLPPFIAFATSRATVFAVVSLALVACCALLQRVLASRIRRRVEEIEYVG